MPSNFYVLNKHELSISIKNKAKELGFTSCGIAKAAFLEDEAPKLEAWLSNKFQGKMQYMENHFDKRLDPRLLVNGAQSVISLSYNYYSEKQQHPEAPKISIYAYGEDYHHVVKDKLKQLLNLIETLNGKTNARIFTDSAPVMERAWAAKSGLGWVGKHSLLIQKAQGSYFFLAEIILDVALEYDQAFVTDHCGNCRACMDACPTDAIVGDKIVDANKCISYLTIELKDELPTSFQDKMEDWMFGCDICQQVCPWNRFSVAHQEAKFEPHPLLLTMDRKEWSALKEETFNELFKKSAVKRTKYEGLKRNIEFLNPTHFL